ncbi:MAG: nucleotidyltransferase, partial [Corynebacterium sp.]|nr:nucleotidyltransferase [Corynebacterium sp.]
MAHLKQQFKDALSSIEPGHDKANAPEAHRLVRDVLEADAKLAEYGVSPVLIGSYKRNVSIKRVKDVDVFVRLPDVPSDVTSKDILDRFFTVLHAEFGTDSDGHRRTKRQDRSLQVSFPEYDLYVDAVPARPHWDGETWEIPQKGDVDTWVRTNPETLTSLSSEMNAAHDAYYVPTVKLLRQTRRSFLGLKKPGGFFIEVATYQAFASGLVSGNDQAEYYVSALEEVSKIIDGFVSYGVGVNDPTLSGHTISIRATGD